LSRVQMCMRVEFHHSPRHEFFYFNDDGSLVGLR
jgi:hypothetical protein